MLHSDRQMTLPEHCGPLDAWPAQRYGNRRAAHTTYSQAEEISGVPLTARSIVVIFIIVIVVVIRNVAIGSWA